MYKFEGPEQVEIRKVIRPSHFGIASYPNSVTTIVCPITERGYKTGLSEAEQSHFEEILSLKKGELAPHSDWWTKVFNVEHYIRLNNTKKTVLILDNPINQLKYKVLLATNKVANSEISKTPESEFYINDTEARAKAESEIFNYEFDGMEQILKMTNDERKSTLRLFGKAGLDESSELMLKSELGKELKKDPKNFHRVLNDADLGLKGWILELHEKGLLTRSGNGYKFGDEIIASSLEAAVEFFKNPKNHDSKLMLNTSLDKLKKPAKVSKITK